MSFATLRTTAALAVLFCATGLCAEESLAETDSLDEVLSTMTSKNRDEYTDKLSSAQLAMFEQKEAGSAFPTPGKVPACEPDLQTPSSADINQQYLMGGVLPGPGSQYLKTQKVHKFNPFIVQSDSRSYDEQSVYGYNDDLSLDLDGGLSKSFTRDYKLYKVNYQTSLPEECIDVFTEDSVVAGFQHSIRYFTQRGFPQQITDVPDGFEQGFQWINYNYSLDFATLTLQFVYDECSCPPGADGHGQHRRDKNCACPPIAIDVNPSPWGAYGIGLYEADQNKYRNGHWYPIRVPLAEDCSTYQSKVGVEPVAFLDKDNCVVSIDIPENSYFLGSYVLQVPQPGFNIDEQESLVSFKGSFNLLWRNPQGEYRKTSNPKKATVLAQASPAITFQSDVTFFGFSFPVGVQIPYETDGKFTGAVCAIENSGPSFDWFTIPFGVPDPTLPPGFTSAGGPFPLFPGASQTWLGYPLGSNPQYKLPMSYNNTWNINGFDNQIWLEKIYQLPRAVLNGETYPEEVGTTAGLAAVTPENVCKFLMCHEMGHGVGWGATTCIPFEAFATALEQDPRGGVNCFLPDRAASWAIQHTGYTRGRRTMMDPLLFEPSEGGSSSTYGQSYFWRYLATTFDHNYQVMRRTVDILSNQTAGPLFRSAGFANMSDRPIVNPTGGSLALAQALNEISGKTIGQVWTDFCISLCYMRNNTAIPQQYRHKFPYWIWNSEYADFDKLQAAMGEHEITVDCPYPAVLPELASAVRSSAKEASLVRGSRDAARSDKDVVSLQVEKLLKQPGGASVIEHLRNRRKRLQIKSECGDFGNINRNVSQYANWWEILNNNDEIPAEWAAVASGNMIATLPQEGFSSDANDLTCFIFSVPHDTNQVSIHIGQGEWNVTVVQFTSDGSSAGEWIQDPIRNLGPNGNTIFDIAAHVPAYNASSDIYLVCAHVSLTDLGGLSNYFADVAPTGHISISSN